MSGLGFTEPPPEYYRSAAAAASQASDTEDSMVADSETREASSPMQLDAADAADEVDDVLAVLNMSETEKRAIRAAAAQRAAPVAPVPVAAQNDFIELVPPRRANTPPDRTTGSLNVLPQYSSSSEDDEAEDVPTTPAQNLSDTPEWMRAGGSGDASFVGMEFDDGFDRVLDEPDAMEEETSLPDVRSTPQPPRRRVSPSASMESEQLPVPRAVMRSPTYVAQPRVADRAAFRYWVYPRSLTEPTPPFTGMLQYDPCTRAALFLRENPLTNMARAPVLALLDMLALPEYGGPFGFSDIPGSRGKAPARLVRFPFFTSQFFDGIPLVKTQTGRVAVDANPSIPWVVAQTIDRSIRHALLLARLLAIESDESDETRAEDVGALRLLQERVGMRLSYRTRMLYDAPDNKIAGFQITGQRTNGVARVKDLALVPPDFYFGPGPAPHGDPLSRALAELLHYAAKPGASASVSAPFRGSSPAAGLVLARSTAEFRNPGQVYFGELLRNNDLLDRPIAPFRITPPASINTDWEWASRVRPYVLSRVPIFALEDAYFDLLTDGSDPSTDGNLQRKWIDVHSTAMDWHAEVMNSNVVPLNYMQMMATPLVRAIMLRGYGAARVYAADRILCDALGEYALRPSRAARYILVEALNALAAMPDEEYAWAFFLPPRCAQPMSTVDINVYAQVAAWYDRTADPDPPSENARDRWNGDIFRALLDVLTRGNISPMWLVPFVTVLQKVGGNGRLTRAGRDAVVNYANIKTAEALEAARPLEISEETERRLRSGIVVAGSVVMTLRLDSQGEFVKAATISAVRRQTRGLLEASDMRQITQDVRLLERSPYATLYQSQHRV